MKKNWHAESLAKIIADLDCRLEGLSEEEAKERLKRFGFNVLPQGKPHSKMRLFLSQLNSPLIYILFVAVIISLFLGHYSDAVFILVVLLINTAVAFYQENKANESLRALKQMIKIITRVLRGGYEKEIDSEEIVSGDIVILKAGDKVPADGRIIEAKGLKINEASLTGEWQAIEKEPIDSLPENTSLSERKNMVFMGTIVEEGWAKVLTVATGVKTQFGEIVSLLKDTEKRKTPLQRKIVGLSRWLGAFILFIIALIIIESCFTEKNFIDVFVAALALAVSAIPEGLLPAITVILVLGMRRIFRQKGLVRKLAATETLGGVTVICTDKTGTLAEGQMQVSHILTGAKELIGDEFLGVAKGKDNNSLESHITALKIAVLANEAFIENPEAALEDWVVRGRSTEKALLLAGLHAGLDKQELIKQYPVIDKLSFNSAYKFSATYHKKDRQHNVLFVLGAPEEIIARCVVLEIDGKSEKMKTAKVDELIKKVDILAGKGLRVLACAYKNYSANTEYKKIEELVKDLSLVGFIALKDPLRQDARESILITKKAGIRTIIVTGS